NEIKTYAVRTKDNEKRRIEDFLFDDCVWTIRYAVIDTGKWLPGRLVLLSPNSFRSINSTEKSLSVEVTTKQIERSPSLEVDKPISRQKEEELALYYNWPSYWTEPNVLPPWV